MEIERQDLWQSALAKLELTLTRPSFLTWFQETGISQVENGIATVCVPNGFAKEWLQNKYHKTILHVLRELSPDVRDISYIIARLDTAKNHIALKDSISKKKRMSTGPFETEEFSTISELTVDPQTNLNPRYTFDNFIVGSFNDVAHAAAQSVLERPGTGYNPLFIYGGVGLGKTHLIQAIGSEMLKKYAGITVRYVPSERFMIEIVEALKNQEMNRLKEKYRAVDLLIMDDIQFIARTEKIQEEFFHTFNALYAQNKQIVISSDKPPQSIDFIDERLKSRFEGGMVVDIGYPEYEMRLTILKSKAKERGAKLSDEILDYIANHIHNNIRELEGALNIIIASSKAAGFKITLEKAKKSLTYIIKKPRKSIGVKKILKCIADFYEISEKEILSQDRRREVAHPRQVMMYLMREEMKYSYPLIGSRLGGRDHTTVIHACNKITESLKKNDEQLAEEINLLKQEIYSA